MLSRYKILEHTADLRIKAFGKTEQELFLNALLGMTESQRCEIKSKKDLKREVKIESPDLIMLLVDFLNEALYLGQVNKEAYFDIRFNKFFENTDQIELKGELIGNKVERFGEDIKAATYHGLNIIRNKNGLFEATIVFDI